MLGKKPECVMCHTSESNIWNKSTGDSVICNDCVTNKTTCLPASSSTSTRKSRSSSPGADVGESPTSEVPDSLQPGLKIQRLESELNDPVICNNKEDEKQTPKKSISKDDNKERVSINKDEINGNSAAVQSSKSKASKDKNKKEETHEDKDDNKRETRRKTRRGKQSGKGMIPKGKSRRYIFKKSATKAPIAVSVPVTSESLMFKGQYYQVGDIVSVEDVSGLRYYCQVRGLLQDQYCEKSAVLTWLLPTTHSPPPEKTFDPTTYIIGPEEELPRKLEHLEFVCHAPSDYFKLANSPYPTAPTDHPRAGYLWARMGPLQVTGAK